MTEREIYLYLTGAGLTAEGAAGLMGNLMAESGLNPRNLENGYEKKLGMTDDEYTAAVDSGRYQNFVYDKAGYGLAQWTWWSRKQNLLTLARQKGVSIGDPDMQLSFLLTELVSYGELWALLKTTADMDLASDMVLTRFERPADMGEKVKETRRKYAREIYARCVLSSPAENESSSGNPSYSQNRTATVDGADSPLVSVTCWTNSHSGKRTEKISKITIHHMAGVASAESCMKYHKKAEYLKASAQYYIGNDGQTGQAVHEADRAWTSSSSWNDNRAVTIEVSNSKAAEPWPVSEAAYRSLIALCADICRRNGISGLHYTGDKNGSLTEHRMFSSTACPGTTLHNLLASGAIEKSVNLELSGNQDAAYRSYVKDAGYCSYVRVTIKDLNIRKNAGTEYGIVGICPPGIYTITEERAGRGSRKGWGKLKSGVGWISMDFVEKLP